MLCAKILMYLVVCTLSVSGLWLRRCKLVRINLPSSTWLSQSAEWIPLHLHLDRYSSWPVCKIPVNIRQYSPSPDCCAIPIYIFLICSRSITLQYFMDASQDNQSIDKTTTHTHTQFLIIRYALVFVKTYRHRRLHWLKLFGCTMFYNKERKVHYNENTSIIGANLAHLEEQSTEYMPGI